MEFSQFNPIKCFVHSGKIRKILRDEFPPPVVLNLDLTNKCNYRCLWCYVDSFIQANPVELSIEVASKIIIDAANFGVKSILFTGGGEPLMYPYFLEMVKIAAAHNLQIGLTTNGSLLYKVVEHLSYKYFKYIRISFDAGTEKTYKKVHQSEPRDFQNVLDAAFYISKHKNSNCQLGMAYLATPYNFEEIPQALELAEQYGFDYLSIRPAVLRATLSNIKLKEIASICSGIHSEKVQILPLKHRIDSMQKPEHFVCRATPLVAIVTADAKFNLCCQYRCNLKYQWGDLSKNSYKNSFSELWGNKEHKKLIANIDSSKCPLCRMIPYNEIIEKAFIQDKMHLNFL